MKTVLLIDFENVQEVPLESIDPGSIEVRLYVGKSQNRVPFELASAAQRLGEAFSWHKIAGEGKNNLDFHIAFELGKLSAGPDRDCEYVILSKDTGYDHLLEYARGLGIRCRRIRTLADLPQGAHRRGQSERGTTRTGRTRGVQAQKSAQGERTGQNRRAARPAKREATGESPRRAAPGRAGSNGSALPRSLAPSRTGTLGIEPSGVEAERGSSTNPTAARIIAAGGLLAELLLNLQRLPPNRRPHSRGRLAKYLESTFRGKAEPERLKETIERLFLEGLLQEDNRRIYYSI